MCCNSEKSREERKEVSVNRFSVLRWGSRLLASRGGALGGATANEKVLPGRGVSFQVLLNRLIEVKALRNFQV